MSRRLSIKYTDEIILIPTWINENYFLDIVKKCEPNFRKLQHFKAVPAAAAGEHYASLLLRIAISIELNDGNTKLHSYILKSMLETETAAAFIKTLGHFPKEQEMYATLLPQFEYLYKEVGMTVRFGPTCLRTEETPNRITLVLEDLKELKFQHVNRLEGLDMLHMKAALQKLAEFHAASVVWHQRNGNFGEKFKVGLVSERSRRFFEERSALILKAFTTSMQEWGFAQKDCIRYQQKVPTAQQFVDELINLGRVETDTFNVLNHGDIWSNNIMFNYNDGDNGDEVIKDTYFVDYQLCKYGTPSYDLYLLILSSAQLDIKVNQFVEFLNCYQQHLQQCLEKLKFKGTIPTLDDIKDLLSRDRFYAFFMISGYLPVILMPPAQESTIETRIKGGENAQRARIDSMLNPLYVQQMKLLMPWLCNGGFLDF